MRSQWFALVLSKDYDQVDALADRGRRSVKLAVRFTQK